MDGVWGGATPGREISAAIFVERQTFPDSITHALTDEGTLGEEKDRQGLNGIEREFQVDIRMTLSRAIAFRAWLDRHIKLLQENHENRGEETTDGE